MRIVLSVPRHGTPRVLSNRVIARGFVERTDPNALIIGPKQVLDGVDSKAVKHLRFSHA